MKNMIRSSKIFGGIIAAAAVVTICAPLIANAAVLTRQLQFGMSGPDVSVLQSFLATDVTIYPQGLVTGYFGGLTRTAVSNFQVRNDIPAVGRVGPITLGIINAQLATGIIGGADISAPIISAVNVSPSSTSAVVNFSTNELARAQVYYSTSPIILGEHAYTVDVSGLSAMTDTNLRTSHGIALSNLAPNTTYYYSVYTTDAAGNINLTWPSTFHTSL